MTLEIILSRGWQEAFLVELARRCSGRALVGCRGQRLELSDMDAAAVATALAALFPRWEQTRLAALCRRLYPACTARRRQEILALAQARLERLATGPAESLYQGAGRLSRLSQALAEQLAQGRLEWAGFCRFRLPGHRAWLEEILAEAGQSWLEQAEEQDYQRLLQRAARPRGQGPELHLFFSPPCHFHLWQRDEAGIRQLEGGRCQQAAAPLLATLISRRPQAIVIHDSACAPASWLPLLTEIFAERLVINS